MRVCSCLLCLALVAGLAFFGAGPAHAQDREGDYVDVGVTLEVPDQHTSIIFQRINIIVVNQGSRTAYDVKVTVDVVKPEDSYYFAFEPTYPVLPVGSASLENDDRSFRWSIPVLEGLQRVELSEVRAVHKPTVNNPEFDNSLIPHEYFGNVTTSSFESDAYKGNNTSRVWSYIYGEPTNEYRQAAGNYTVVVSVDEPSPSPGDTVNFTITADRTKPTGYIGIDVPPIDTKVDIELTGGLSVSGTPTYLCADLATCTVPAQVSYSNGKFDVGTLKANDSPRNSVTLPILVASSAVVNEQCLTATITGNPPPGTGPLDDDVSDNVARLCLGDSVEPFSSGQIDAFTVYPCVGVTSSPCDNTDDVRVRAVNSSGRVLSPGTAVFHVNPTEARNLWC